MVQGLPVIVTCGTIHVTHQLKITLQQISSVALVMCMHGESIGRAGARSFQDHPSAAKVATRDHLAAIQPRASAIMWPISSCSGEHYVLYAAALMSKMQHRVILSRLTVLHTFLLHVLRFGVPCR